jgi:hypothetical protein
MGSANNQHIKIMDKETIQISANQVDIVDYEEVLHRDPEHADVGNPQGNVYGIRYYVRVTLEDGTRYLHFKGFDKADLDDAVTLQVAVSKRRVIDLKHWVEVDPAYGSKAYEVADEEREYQFRSSLATGDYGRAELFC